MGFAAVLATVSSSNQVGRKDLTPMAVLELRHLISSRRRLWYTGGTIQAGINSFSEPTGSLIFCTPAFLSRFEEQKKGPLLCHIVLLQFPQPSGPWACLQACLEACPEMFCSDFHQTALKPASNFLASFNFFFCCNFPTLELRGLPWVRLFAPAAA